MNDASNQPPLAAPAAPLRRYGTLILIVVFVLGLIAGGGGAFWLVPHLRRDARRHLPLPDRLQHLLQLNAQQKRQIGAIIDATRQHWQQTHGQFAPQYQQLRDQEEELRRREMEQFRPFREQADNQIRNVLNPQQRAKFDQWLAEFRRRHAPPAAGAAAPVSPRARRR